MIEEHWISTVVVAILAIIGWALWYFQERKPSEKKEEPVSGVLLLSKDEMQYGEGQGIYVNFTVNPMSFQDQDTVILKVWEIKANSQEEHGT